MNIILPIHRKWIDKNIAEEKTMEIRKGVYRQRPNVIFVYETAPVSRVIGQMKVTDMGNARWWDSFDPIVVRKSCVSIDELNDYLGIGGPYTYYIVEPPEIYEVPLKLRLTPQSLIYTAATNREELEKEYGELHTA